MNTDNLASSTEQVKPVFPAVQYYYTRFSKVNRFISRNRNSLLKNATQERPSQEWFDELAKAYKDGNSVWAIASVLNESGRWDAITRSVAILGKFERLVGTHICAFWNECDKGHTNETIGHEELYYASLPTEDE